MTFALHPRLSADAHFVGDLPLSRALLMNDARYAWLILVPRRPDLTELTDLSRSERATLMDEIAQTCEIVRALPDVEKVNVGALGNVVRQLHIHIVGRNARDFAWPGPVWGAGRARPYVATEREILLVALRSKLDIKPKP